MEYRLWKPLMCNSSVQTGSWTLFWGDHPYMCRCLPFAQWKNWIYCSLAHLSYDRGPLSTKLFDTLWEETLQVHTRRHTPGQCSQPTEILQHGWVCVCVCISGANCYLTVTPMYRWLSWKNSRWSGSSWRCWQGQWRVTSQISRCLLFLPPLFIGCCWLRVCHKRKANIIWLLDTAIEILKVSPPRDTEEEWWRGWVRVTQRTGVYRAGVVETV